MKTNRLLVFILVAFFVVGTMFPAMVKAAVGETTFNKVISLQIQLNKV